MPPIKLLVADDNDDGVMLLAEAFRLIDCAVTIRRAVDGQGTLDALLDHMQSYDLVTLDYFLPKMNAPEILEHLHNSGGVLRTPIVILSSHTNPREHGRLRELGVVLFAEKPNDLEGLCTLARKMLGYVRP